MTRRAHNKSGNIIHIDKTVEKIDISAYREKFKQLKEVKEKVKNEEVVITKMINNANR